MAGSFNAWQQDLVLALEGLNIIKQIVQDSLSLLSPTWTPIGKDPSTMNISGPTDVSSG